MFRTRDAGFQLMSPGLVHGSRVPIRELLLTVGAERWLTGEKENGSVAGVFDPVTEAWFCSVTVLPMPGCASPFTLKVFFKVMLPFEPSRPVIVPLFPKSTEFRLTAA